MNANAKRRNKLRGLGVDLATWGAKTLLIAGLVKPLFAPEPNDLLLSILAVVVALVLIVGAFYVTARMEPEE